MTKMSDNQSPKLTMLESAAPSTPSSGLGFIYEKTDGNLYFKNDGGTESQITGGASGIPATILDAKGDLIAASAADTAARLAAGANGTFLQAQSGESTGLKWASGTIVRVTNSANVALTQNNYKYITFDTDRFDPAGFHDTSSNTSRLTVPTGYDGNYIIGFHGECTAGLGAGEWGVFRLNGTTLISLLTVPNDASATFINGSTVYPLVAGDYVEIGIHTSGASKNLIYNDILEPIFWLARLP